MAIGAVTSVAILVGFLADLIFKSYMQSQNIEMQKKASQVQLQGVREQIKGASTLQERGEKASKKASAALAAKERGAMTAARNERASQQAMNLAFQAIQDFQTPGTESGYQATNLGQMEMQEPLAELRRRGLIS